MDQATLQHIKTVRDMARADLREASGINECKPLAEYLRSLVEQIEPVIVEAEKRSAELASLNGERAGTLARLQAAKSIRASGTRDPAEAAKRTATVDALEQALLAIAQDVEATQAQLLGAESRVDKLTKNYGRSEAENETTRIALNCLSGHDLNLDGRDWDGIAACPPTEVRRWWPLVEARALAMYGARADSREGRNAYPLETLVERFESRRRRVESALAYRRQAIADAQAALAKEARA